MSLKEYRCNQGEGGIKFVIDKKGLIYGRMQIVLCFNHVELMQLLIQEYNQKGHVEFLENTSQLTDGYFIKNRILIRILQCCSKVNVKVTCTEDKKGNVVIDKITDMLNKNIIDIQTNRENAIKYRTFVKNLERHKVSEEKHDNQLKRKNQEYAQKYGVSHYRPT